MNRLLSVAILGLTFILGSCDEASAPKGRDGVVTVRAYVDRDASGTFTEGVDSVLQNFEVSLVRDGEQVATVTTDEDGVGTSEPLDPGSYQVSIVDGEPTGAALLTNPQPTVAINVRGDSAVVEFRYTFFPGTITGRLWVDDGTTPGEFDDQDTRGAGLYVLLRANVNGSPGAEVLDSVTTDSAGVYTFRNVPPGSYILEFQQTGDFDYGEATRYRAVTVTGREMTTQNATFTGSVLMSVETARTRVGKQVKVRGNVTVRPGTFTSGTNGVQSEIWVQDATGGIAVFPMMSADSLEYAIGDLVEVQGTVSRVDGQEQIGMPGLAWLELTPATVRAAEPVTGAEVNSLADEGKLVVLDSLRVATVAAGTDATFDVTGTTPGGQTVTLRIHGPAAPQTNTGLTRGDFVVGKYYRVTGVLTEATISGARTAIIKPRSKADVTDVTAPPPPFTGVRFSEIHYDNAVVADEGEAIEVSAPAGTDLTGWQIVLYNGSSTSLSTYDTKTLSGTVPASCGARGVVVQTYPSNGIQNGDPDGFALVNASGTVVEFLSYEGTFTAANGPAAGMTSTDIGVREDGTTTPVGHSLQRLPDGTWTGPLANTFGTCNDAPAPPPQAPTRFSEIHYDNAGTDAGESIEVAGPAGTDLTGWQIVLYNGNGGVTYGTPAVLSGPIPATCGARGVMVVTYPSNGLQNGGAGAATEPDGFALIDAAGAVVEFLSYEGTITATSGPASGLTSTNIGVFEDGTTALATNSLQRIADGTWTGPIANTFGACNDN